jgi:peroxin-5
LANSGKSEEAIEAYHHALDIKPTFVRARYNLGVSCINIGCYTEVPSSKIILIAGRSASFGSACDASSGRRFGWWSQYISKFGTSLQSGSNLQWETLRRVFLCLDRRDLAEKAASGVDVNIFRKDFDF